MLFNYLENSIKVPWEDLRYLFGEIMYGGHITDDWDRRLCRTYLIEYLKQELVEGKKLFTKSNEIRPAFDVCTYVHSTWKHSQLFQKWYTYVV